MSKKTTSVIKLLIVFGIALLLSVLLSESKTSVKVTSQYTASAEPGSMSVVEKEVDHWYVWQLAPPLSHLFFAFFVTMALWLCTVIYKNNKETKGLRRSFDSLSESLMRHETTTHKQIEDIRKSVSELRFESMKLEGKFRFTKDMPLTEAIAVHPDVAKVLFGHGLACVSCPSAAGETLEQAALVHGLDVQPILDDLNKLLQD